MQKRQFITMPQEVDDLASPQWFSLEQAQTVPMKGEKKKKTSTRSKCDVNPVKARDVNPAHVLRLGCPRPNIGMVLLHIAMPSQGAKGAHSY